MDSNKVEPMPQVEDTDGNPPTSGNYPAVHGNFQGGGWQGGAMPMYGMHAITTQPNVVVVAQPSVLRPSSYFGFSCFTFWCCNMCFGGIALICSCISRSVADGGDLECARTYGCVALVLDIIGIISTWVVLVSLLIFLFLL